MDLFSQNQGVWALRSLMLRRFFDLQYASVERCLRRSIATLPSGDFRVLDFGAGQAPYHSLFATALERGGRPRFVMETLDPHAAAMHRRWEDIPTDTKYDLILAIETLEHMENPVDFFRGARERLSPSGEVWLSVPYSVRVHPCPEDWHRWTPQGFVKLIRENGFEILELTMRGPSPRAILAKLAYQNFILLRTPCDSVTRLLRFLLGILALPITTLLLGLTHLLCAPTATKDDDPLGFFTRIM